MNRILIVTLIAMSMFSISCNENEFASSVDALSKIESGEVSEQNIEVLVPSEEEVLAVAEIMEEDEVLEAQEPLEEVVVDPIMSSKYSCHKKPKKIKKKKCNKKKHMASDSDEVVVAESDEVIASESVSDKMKKRKKKRGSKKDMVAASDDSEELMASGDEVSEEKISKRDKRRAMSSAVEKVMLCHVPKGNPDKEKTLCLPKVAIDNHLKALKQVKSLSYLGPCKKQLDNLEVEDIDSDEAELEEKSSEEAQY